MGKASRANGQLLDCFCARDSDNKTSGTPTGTVYSHGRKTGGSDKSRIMNTNLAEEIQTKNIQKLLERFAELSTGGPGVTRLGYTELEREAHEIFAEHHNSLGATVWVDTAGNTIAELAATVEASEAAAVATGSHLDSVPQGGA